MKTRTDLTATDYVAASYRYLRLAIVVVVFTLGASLAIELIRHECQLGSISAYYYTPVHSVFIGALITIGVVMIALKGADAIEDMLFNIAGVLAPIVALVPTKRPGNLCREGQVVVVADDLITNNVPALVIGFVVAIGLAVVIAYRQEKITSVRLDRATKLGLGVSVTLLAAGVVWYSFFGDGFRRWAHGTTAIAMFVLIWMAVAVNAGWPPRLLRWAYAKLGEPMPESLTEPTPRHRRYRTGYRIIGWFMPIAAAAVLVFVPKDVKVFWLEVVEIIPFAAFWTLQTLEAWETGTTNTAPAD